MKIIADMPSSYNIKTVEETLGKVEKFIKETSGFVSLSSVIGSEPGEISFGGGRRNTSAGEYNSKSCNER